MIEPRMDDAPAGSWWSRLTQALLREPTVVLLEKDADAPRLADREGELCSCESAR
ncbi:MULTISPECIES: hypothetical protein [unclassified Sphingobium]|jgi:hypothetical protein|uniref:hypothetical protein n=1 Tax=unclassified Sphingobium TaxID=2611147 RepID=UPI000A4247EF|nr:MULTISPECIES: hypothetical protein [unclassified Sphingobium]WIW87725.1 hypothetical protein K3M67_12210 [Sphingobium sp. V4]